MPIVEDVSIAHDAPATTAPITVTLLGTGTPYPSIERFGSAILVRAGGRTLLFDCGRGAVIRLSQAGIDPASVTMLFLTHLHADHTVGIPDLWLTGWFLGRSTPLRVWGPAGTQQMLDRLAEAYRFDVDARVAPPERLSAQGAAIRAHDIDAGPVYESGPLRVTAVLVDHGSVEPAFGYRVDLAGRSVVISGDTKLSQALIDIARGTECLLHVAWQPASRNRTPEAERSIASAEDAGRAFADARPALGVVYHYLEHDGMSDAVRACYDGEFVIGRDLMTINIGARTMWRHAPDESRP